MRQMRRLRLLWALHNAGLLTLYVTMTREANIRRILERELGSP